MANAKILIIDTEKNVLINYKNSLEGEGYQVDMALNEDEARKKLSQYTYPIVVSELYLKEKSTISLIQQLHKEQPETYIIMTTAQSQPFKIYADAFEAGAEDCFHKPFPVDNLLLNIKKGLRRTDLYTKKKELEEKLNNIEKFLLNQEPMIYDHLHFLKALRQELKRADRFKHPFSILIIESNFFSEKGYFSNSNHRWRDEFAKITLSTIRNTDVIAENNGSYSFIFPETSKSAINHVAKRLQKKITEDFSKNQESKRTSIGNSLHFTFAAFPEDIDFIKHFVDTLQKNSCLLHK